MIRSAQPTDLDEITNIFLDCWRVNYGGLTPLADLAPMSPEAAKRIWTKALADGGGTALVWQDPASESLLGLVRFAGAVNKPGKIYSLYVSPNSQGQGVGKRLLNRACEIMAESGSLSAELWVFEMNAPSQAFYSALGWYPDGTREINADFGEPQLRFVKKLWP